MFLLSLYETLECYMKGGNGIKSKLASYKSIQTICYPYFCVCDTMYKAFLREKLLSDFLLKVQ